ncbi:hypothetical protein [Streptomyces sp. NL15-2K]|uniref:hypothetical protein n=1 Tax=Streptomyces sp. NL15-2K TaxID=376149 RepID=UPI000F573DB0|nr:MULTISPECIES: hypothetical protein [Actinomycetes]WKX12730.1 hypothetical protein Q4V64_36500 [Kutzneria buriramensis]GCB45925.1 hypothetical protein SNL152K_3221 [Streptomyces sp. NL15-2K]
MGLFDRLTGTRYPDAGVAPLSATEVRAALLAFNGPDVPYRVRGGLPEEKADLVAEWRMVRSVVGSVPRKQLERTFKIRMRLVPQKHEVRALDEQWKVTRVGDSQGLVVAREYGRGPAPSRSWTYERGPDGRRRMVERTGVGPQEMKNPLRDAVLGAGWTWRGVLNKP